jgi:predicted transposase YdaD
MRSNLLVSTRFAAGSVAWSWLPCAQFPVPPPPVPFPPMADHDLSYKHLFSHHEMVRDLFEGFVRKDWVAQLNLRSPQKDNASYVSDTLRARRGDLVWEVPLADGLASLHVLLEFQSTVDAGMAVRMLSYASLRYQDLLKSGRVRSEGPLPPVLPIVLYNGRNPWTAA